MAEIEKTVETKVHDVDINLDDIFTGAPGAASITLPEETDVDKKPNVFSRSAKVDMSFLNEEDMGVKEETLITEVTDDTTDLNVEDEKPVLENAEEGVEVKEEVTEDTINELLAPDSDEDEVQPKKRGRKPITGMADVFSKLIADDKIVELEQRIQELKRFQTSLKALSHKCCGGEENAIGCSILDALEEH
jgi:hypothetical protein